VSASSTTDSPSSSPLIIFREDILDILIVAHVKVFSVAVFNGDILA
jgi:hypothetical protein